MRYFFTFPPWICIWSKFDSGLCCIYFRVNWPSIGIVIPKFSRWVLSIDSTDISLFVGIKSTRSNLMICRRRSRRFTHSCFSSLSPFWKWFVDELVGSLWIVDCVCIVNGVFSISEFLLWSEYFQNLLNDDVQTELLTKISKYRQWSPRNNGMF